MQKCSSNTVSVRTNSKIKSYTCNRKNTGILAFIVIEYTIMSERSLTFMYSNARGYDALSKTADSDTVLTYQVSSVQLVTDKKLEAFNKA